MNQLKKEYLKQKEEIKRHLKKFDNKSDYAQLQEYMFCILTPQSKAERCWEVVTLLPNQKSYEEIKKLLRGKVRFHNTKSKRLFDALIIWPRIKSALNTKDKKELRNWIAETVPGYGLKESGHFLRNIGHSKNKIAILDRHILRNLIKYGAIKENKIKGSKHYESIEKQTLEFSKKIDIPIDELDLLFWYNEHGKYFK